MLSPGTWDSVVVAAWIMVGVPLYAYTLKTLFLTGAGLAEQRSAERSRGLAAFDSPAVEAEPEDTGGAPSSGAPGSVTGAPSGGSENPRSDRPGEGPKRPRSAGD